MGPSSSSCSKGSVPSSDARLEQDSKLLMLLKVLANGFSKTHPDFWEHKSGCLSCHQSCPLRLG